MNYLQLVQRLRIETNYANTGPTTVTGQNGDHERAIAWVADSYRRLQNRHQNWRWLRKKFTLTTTNNLDVYDYGAVIDTATSLAISRFKRWEITDPTNPPRCYLQSSGVGTEYWLTYVPWEYFRTIYQIGNQVPGAPSHITIDPNNNLVIGPTPNGAYVISGEYHRSAQVLSGNTDTPELPDDYHMLIVYMAMEHFGYFDSAQEVLARSGRMQRQMLRQLEQNQLPAMRKAGPMA
jgi:hypothetical protein